MKTEYYFDISTAINIITAIAVAILATSCAASSASSTTIEPMNAVDGTRCYVLIQDGSAKGVSCAL